jgi:hypothetical protein
MLEDTMPPEHTVAVIDFRRTRLVLQWHILGGTWTPLDVPPPLVHGIALIRPTPPNLCLWSKDNVLRLQVGAEQFPLHEHSPQIHLTRGVASFGLRRRFSVEATPGGVLFSQSYWVGDGEDFFRWVTARAEDPQWRQRAAVQWTEGLAPAVLRGGS